MPGIRGIQESTKSQNAEAVCSIFTSYSPTSYLSSSSVDFASQRLRLQLFHPSPLRRGPKYCCMAVCLNTQVSRLETSPDIYD